MLCIHIIVKQITTTLDYFRSYYNNFEMDFVNAGKLDEEIKRRQAEWERVRKKEDPIGKK